MSDQASTERTVNSAGERRRKAIMEAAWSLFLEKGYAAVSVDEIIRASGGSKSTLYKFFGSKEGVLKALVESFAETFIREINLPTQPGQTTRETLRRIGLYICKQALSSTAISQYRLAVSNVPHFPKAARLWYDSGPSTTFEALAGYIRRENQAGRLNAKDPDRASVFFLGMLIFKDNMAMSIGADPPSAKEMEEIVSEAVDVFMAAYGT